MKIELKGVTKQFRALEEEMDVLVLRNIDLTINQGDYIAISGKSGAGKTTLLKITGLLDMPSDGKVLVDGKVAENLWKDEMADLRRKQLGFVFQDFRLLENITVYENIILPGIINKIGETQTKKRTKELLECLDIPQNLLKKYPSEISGGEKQRVSIARALFNEPDLILADEPTGNLDDESSKNIENIFERLNKDDGKSILLVTHDMNFSSRAAKQFSLSGGRLIEKKS